MLNYLTPKGVRIFDAPRGKVGFWDQLEFAVQPFADGFQDSAAFGYYWAKLYGVLVDFARGSDSEGGNSVEAIGGFCSIEERNNIIR